MSESKPAPTAQELEQATKEIECAELKRLQELFPEFDFSEVVKGEIDLSQYLRKSIQKYQHASDPLTLPDAPKLNDDFSNYFVINNLPKTTEEKLPKLVTLIQQSIEKSKMRVDPADIQIPINPETEKTDGVAFVKMSSEDNARIGVSIFDGFKLANKHLASCLLPEFDKVMQTSDQFKLQQDVAEFEDLRAPIFDCKNEQFVYKTAAHLHVDYFRPGNQT